MCIEKEERSAIDVDADAHTALVPDTATNQTGGDSRLRTAADEGIQVTMDIHRKVYPHHALLLQKHVGSTRLCGHLCGHGF